MTDLASSPAEAARNEVVALHALFEEWLGGTGPDTEATFARVETALAPSFTMVGPDGHRVRRDEVVSWLRGAHGAKGREGPFRITIRDVEILHEAGPLVALGYVEDQLQGATRSIRRSTALFEVTAEGARWLALHETWLRVAP